MFLFERSLDVIQLTNKNALPLIQYQVERHMAIKIEDAVKKV